jgi:hypothetical protein
MKTCWPAAAASCSDPGNAQLPLPPMLMFDRITEITSWRRRIRQGSRAR